jgi:hypothetical protein
VKIRRLGLSLFMAAVLLPASVFGGPGRAGMMIMFSLQSLDFRGDLSGDLTLWHFEKAFFIPRLEKGSAMSVSLGGKNAGGSWDVSYLRSTHTVDIEGEPRTASFHAVEINGRSFFLKKSFFHPYFLGGISLPIVHVDEGSFFRGRRLDAIYFGGGLNAGAGLLFDLGPSIVLNAGLVYRWIRFLYVTGDGKGRDINNLRIGFEGPEFKRLLRTDSLTLTIGLGFIL